jgi:glycosyltransferase involved in cell wall biosynthesis
MTIAYVSVSEFSAMKANSLQTIAMCNAFARREKTQLFFFDDDGREEAVLRRNFTLEPALQLAPVKRRRYPLKPRLLNLLRMTRLAAQAAGPDGIVYTREVFVAFFLTFFGPKNLIEHHLELREPWHRILLHWITRSPRFLAHVPISGFLAKSIGLDRLSAAKLLVLHDGVDLSLFEGTLAKAQARRRLGLPAEGFMAGYAGQLYRDKGAHFILHLAEALPDTLFLLVGGEPKDLLAMQSAKAERALENVILAGRVEQSKVPEYLAACDCFLLPNIVNYYMSPLKLFEYMASDRPIIASDFPPFREIIEPDMDGLLARPNDTGAFRDAILNLRRDPQLSLRLAEAARRKVREEFSWDARAARVLAMAGAPSDAVPPVRQIDRA